MFVKSLVAELKENDVPFWSLLAIVKGVLMPKEFNKDKPNSHKLKVIGGNHQRVAILVMQTEDPDNIKYKYTEVIS